MACWLWSASCAVLTMCCPQLHGLLVSKVWQTRKAAADAVKAVAATDAGGMFQRLCCMASVSLICCERRNHQCLRYGVDSRARWRRAC